MHWNGNHARSRTSQSVSCTRLGYTLMSRTHRLLATRSCLVQSSRLHAQVSKKSWLQDHVSCTILATRSCLVHVLATRSCIVHTSWLHANVACTRLGCTLMSRAQVLATRSCLGLLATRSVPNTKILSTIMNTK